jgi:exopolyphosphatase/guanosine-5'-triphosphate,3'-diphosphate pyrophosphatase
VTYAAVDVGSNSVHLLVARVDGHRLEVVDDESTFLGLGEAVAGRGLLGAAARRELSDTLAGYAGLARDLGAAGIVMLGTEPIRGAADAAAIVTEARVKADVPLFVLTHVEEALLTVVGVTEGLPVIHETLVVDVGGGSSEFCVVGPSEPARATGIRLGSATLTARHVANDPPTPEEVAAMRAAASTAIAAAPDAHPTEIVAVGGTASNLLKVSTAPPPLDATLTRDRIAEVGTVLAAEPAAAAAEHHGINPRRARVLPAGAAILDAILVRYGAEQVRVSEASAREGAIFAMAHDATAWRDRLADLARGWRT